MNTLPPSMPAASGWFTLPYAAIIALLIEGILVVVLVFGLSETKKPQPPKPQPIMLTFPTIPAEVAPKPKEPVKSVAKPLPKPVHSVTHQPVPQRHKTETVEPVHELQATTVPTVAKTVANLHQTLPVPYTEKPNPPSVDPNVQARFEDQVRTAVQSAIVYPYVAKSSHISGRTQVSFDYVDGRVSELKIVVSSGYSMLDSAALQAVSAANYPQPPKHLKDQILPFLVWVRFNLTGLATD